MGRAPNSGAPQRVSAHVVPKALSAFADEDEKTTIENGWEEEASTTVEQGEVAEKIRTLGLRPITNVTESSSGMEEPTVDERCANNAGISMITPAAVHARLIVTQGNDSGQTSEIVPGKTYTVGRAIDNDIVLTDIAVSRKHFDLRYENDAWILADRGSGNGTLVNGTIEDAPFMLANGDSIEIGNTTFRFDNPNGIPRNAFADGVETNGFSQSKNITPIASDIFDPDLEEEPSTVAGKPLRDEMAALAPQPLNTSLPLSAPRTPATLPPPVSPPPSRPRTVPPPAPLPRPKLSSVQPVYSPSTAQPLPQPLPPQPQPPQPAILGSRVPLPGVPQQPPSQQPPVLGNVMPTTLPGQGPLHQPPPHGMPFTYPSVNELNHNSSQRAKLLIQASQPPGRDATSTAHVPPAPYGIPVTMQPRSSRGLARRTKLLLAGAALTVFAAIATIAIIKGTSGSHETAEPATNTTEPDNATKPDIQPIAEQPSPKGDTQLVVTPNTAKPTETDPPKQDPPKQDPPKQDPPKKDVVASTDPPKQDPPKQDPPKQDPPKKDPPKKDPPKKDPPKKDPPKRIAIKKSPPKQDPPKRAPQKKRVATADVSSVRAEADQLYRQKKFREAAAALRRASSGTRGSLRTVLRTTAARYEELGKAYFYAMRPSADPAEAWLNLRRAKTYDRQLGGVYTAEIVAKQGKIAGKVALTLTARMQYVDAHEAIKIAEASGNVNGNVKAAKQVLNEQAGALYKTASEEISSNRVAGLQKLRMIKQLVSPNSIWDQRAQKLLAKNGG